MSDHAAHASHPPVNYVRIWQILLALLVVSVLGPMIGIKIVTLITAFGIAVVKAYLVAKNFMHLNVQPRYVMYLLGTTLVFMLLLFGSGFWWVAILAGLVMTSTIETAQQSIPGRVSDPRDVLANTLGTVLGVLLALVLTMPSTLRRRRARRERRALARQSTPM